MVLTAMVSSLRENVWIEKMQEPQDSGEEEEEPAKEMKKERLVKLEGNQGCWNCVSQERRAIQGGSGQV